MYTRFLVWLLFQMNVPFDGTIYTGLRKIVQYNLPTGRIWITLSYELIVLMFHHKIEVHLQTSAPNH